MFYFFYHSINVVEHFVVGETDHLEALFVQELCPQHIGFRLFRFVMIAPIYFYNKLAFQRNEVGYAVANNVLAAEFLAQLLCTQGLPESILSFSRI